MARNEYTYDIDVHSSVRYRQVFTIVREAECIDTVSKRRMRISGTTKIVASKTYSHTVIVLAQIHSDRSNMLTIESYPPDARYLQKYVSTEQTTGT
jgi:hypothetical protein